MKNINAWAYALPVFVVLIASVAYQQGVSVATLLPFLFLLVFVGIAALYFLRGKSGPDQKK